MGTELDRQTSLLAEAFARKLSRRAAIYKMARGVAAATAALSIGNLAAVKDAFASSCGCVFPFGRGCSGCPASGGCPSGCVKCLSSDCPSSPCIYADGNWIDTDCPCGPTGGGYFVCYDCRCLTCASACGCRSACLCGGCRTKQEVAMEMARLGHVQPPI